MEAGRPAVRIQVGDDGGSGQGGGREGGDQWLVGF